MRRASDAATAMVVSRQADGEDERANLPNLGLGCARRD